MKIVTNKNTGKKLCLHCKKVNDCICLPEEKHPEADGKEGTKWESTTELKYSDILYRTKKAVKIKFRKNILENGKVIPSMFECWFRSCDVLINYTSTQKLVEITNSKINELNIT